MSEKLAPEFCRNNNVIFYPKNKSEARSLQKALFEMGFAWSSGGQVVQCIDECIRNGLVIQNGNIYYKGSNDNAYYILCAVEQLDGNYITPERKFLLEQFGKINARLDALEEKIDRIGREVLPQEVDKPVPHSLPKGKGNSP